MIYDGDYEGLETACLRGRTVWQALGKHGEGSLCPSDYGEFNCGGGNHRVAWEVMSKD